MALSNPDISLPPLERATALDPSFYAREDVYRYEMSNLIPTGWQVIAPSSALSDKGDVIARSLGDVPIIIVRSGSGELNGFYNICPHRAGPLATCDMRGTKRLRCGYHGWAYDHEGRLKSAPEMQTAQEFDPATISLTPIEVKDWNGLIFARTQKPESLPFDNMFRDLDQIIGSVLDDLRHHSQTVYEVQANWKVYVDNYLEGYHLPFVHPGLTQVVDYPDYKSEWGKGWSLQRSPVAEDCGAYAAGEALYFFIFPNTMLNILPGRLQTNRVIPTGLNSCKIEFDFYYADTQKFRAAEDYKFSDVVQEEDRLICEHVQKGLMSGVYKPGRLSPAREAGVWHWQNILRQKYASAGLT